MLSLVHGLSINVDIDFASYYRQRRDPDRDSKMLYQWHQMLWGRDVPGVGPFRIEVEWAGGYGLRLHYASGSDFRLGSDAMVPTWSSDGWARRFDPALVEEIASDHGEFFRLSSTIGGYIVLPRNSVGQTGQTLNQARGISPAIADRFDLTLECIRRHYQEPNRLNPLSEPLKRYGDFFNLFGTFETYVRFFLLEDIVSPDCSAVRSLMPGFDTASLDAPALPESPADYREYRSRGVAFLAARNARIHGLGL